MSEDSFSGFTASDVKKIKSAIANNPTTDNNIKGCATKKYIKEPTTLLNLSTKKPKRKERLIRKHDSNKNGNLLKPDERLAAPIASRLDELESDEADNDSEILQNNVKPTTDHKPVIPFKEPTLEDFESRQKFMEKENRKRRALLNSAIKERRKKTQAEQEKLLSIQKDLNKLDDILSADVSVLRDQIDIASAEFDVAHKRYEKTEKEFVEAKLNLFNKMEKKETLTEYLCTIIEKNEERKAKMLEGLMDQLEMEVTTDEKVEHNSSQAFSQLCSLNDISYSSCSTIKDPAKNSKVVEAKEVTQQKEEEEESTTLNSKTDEKESHIEEDQSEKKIENGIEFEKTVQTVCDSHETITVS